MGAPILARLGPRPSIILIRLRSLGDTVLATPAFALLRQTLPRARIHVVMDERFADILEGQPDLDGVLRLAPDARLGAKARLLGRLRGRRPDLCVDMHGGATAAWLTALSGARWRAGFAHFRHAWAYNERIPRAQQVLGRAPAARVHTAEHHAAAMIHLGAAAAEIPAARLAGEAAPREAPYAVLHPGAAYATKRWDAARFRGLAEELRASHALEPVFVLGPGDRSLRASLAGCEVRADLPLAELRSLLAGASLFIGNDSGPAHVAAAFGVPCVVIFGSSDSAAWRPWRTQHRVAETAWDCKPCPGDRCYAFAEPRCILSVEPGAVSRAVADLLSETRPRA